MKFLSDEKKKKLNEFVKYCKNELKLKTVPTISIQNGRGKLKTTANYDYTKENKIIKINAKGRALVDIMRSMAHELVHHRQWEQGKLKNSIEDGTDGSDIENEAHAVAGLIIRKYCKLNDSIYDDIK